MTNQSSYSDDLLRRATGDDARAPSCSRITVNAYGGWSIYASIAAYRGVRLHFLFTLFYLMAQKLESGS